MRLAISGVTDEDLELALQVGATDVVGGGTLPTDKGDMRQFRTRSYAFGYIRALMDAVQRGH